MKIVPVGIVHVDTLSVNLHKLCSVNLEDLAFWVSSISSLSYTFSSSSFTRFRQLWGDGFDGDIIYRSLYFKVSLSLSLSLLHSHVNVCLWVSVFIFYLLEDEVSLTTDEWGTDLWVEQNLIRTHFVTTLFIYFFF